MTSWPDIRSWLTTYALPLWASTGFDHTTNTFIERLTLEGEPIETAPRRLMVQARQIYSYAKAEQYGWIGGAGDLVARAARAMVDRYYEADGQPGWVMSVASSGLVTDTTRDFYAHSFVLLGLASAFKLTRDDFYLFLADKTLSFLDTTMAYEGGGYYPALPLLSKLRLTQNPHMHLLEALLALYDAAPNGDYQTRAGALVSLFEARFVNSTTGTLTEYFEEEWRPANTARGYTFEPGHHYEWVWLLKQYSDLFKQPLSLYCDVLESMAARHGRSEAGLLWSEVSSDGRVIDPSFRLWPHTEAAKAALSKSDVNAANDWLRLLHNAFLKMAYPGAWNDRINTAGNLLGDTIPASSFYHLVCAFTECERAYNNKSDGGR